METKPENKNFLHVYDPSTSNLILDLPSIRERIKLACQVVLALQLPTGQGGSGDSAQYEEEQASIKEICDLRAYERAAILGSPKKDLEDLSSEDDE